MKPGEIPATATPDPAHNLRAYSDDMAMKPQHFQAPAGKEVWFLLQNLGTQKHGLHLEGNDVKKDGPAVDPGKEGGFNITLKAGTYKLSLQGHESQPQFSGEVVVK